MTHIKSKIYQGIMHRSISFSITFMIMALFFVLSVPLRAAEVNKGLVIIDKEPWKTSWIEDSVDGWQLVSWFDKAKLTTYFKAGPTEGLGIDQMNKPIKQELHYFPSGKTYCTKKIQFEQWPDGAKAYAAMYDNKFEANGLKYKGITTAIIQEVNGKENEIRYAYFPDF